MSIHTAFTREVLAASLFYRAVGLKMVANCFQSKKPIDIEWQRRPLETEAELQKAFGNGQRRNIGVITGDELGTADIDCDCAEACALAFRFLPETGFVYGRASKRPSHFFYRIDPAIPSEKWYDPVRKKRKTEPSKTASENDSTKALLFELRCRNKDATTFPQTIVPPSIHESGEPIAFEPGSTRQIANVDADVIRAACAEMSAAIILARYFAPEGSRHEAFLALAGMLAHGGLAIERTLRIHEGIYALLWPKAPNIAACKSEVFTTYEKFQAGEAITGIPTIAKLIREAALVVPAIQHSLQLKEGKLGSKHMPADSPVIIVNNRHPFQLAQETLDALRNGPCEFFGHGFELVHLERTDEKDRLGKRTIMKPATVDKLLLSVSESARFVSVSAKGAPKPARPPDRLAKDILAFGADRWRLPLLTAIVETPVFLPDGRVLSRPGYDPDSQLYYAGPEMPAVPENPTRDEAVAAAKYIGEHLVDDFPVKDQFSRANLYGALMTPLVRHGLDGLAPMCGITAPVAGSGKTTITHVTSILGTGFHAATTSMPPNDEEMNKLLLSVVRQNPGSMLVFDNCVGTIGQPSLDMALTSSLYRSRILGLNKEVTIAHSLSVYATGNNIFVRGDTARRTYWVRLLPDHAPTLVNRRYKHQRLDQWALKHRMHLLWNAFVMCRAWYVAGSPSSSVPRIASYERWSELMGGILEYAGVEGFLATFQADADAAATEQSDWAAFLVEIHRAHGNREFTAGYLTGSLRDMQNRQFEDIREAAPKSIMECLDKGAASAKHIGCLLSEQCERIHLVTLDDGKTQWEYKLISPGKARSGVLKFRVLGRDPQQPWPSF